MSKFKGQFLAIPNLLSYFRIIIIIPFVILFLNDSYINAAALLVVSGVTDVLDGKIARKFNQITELGKVLDPLADKLTLIAVVLCMGTKFPEIVPLVIAFLIKDVAMLIASVFILKRDIVPVASKWYGKMATIVFYLSAICIVFLKAILGISIPFLNVTLFSITAIFMIFALYKYSLLYFQMLSDYKNKK